MEAYYCEEGSEYDGWENYGDEVNEEKKNYIMKD